MRSLLIRSQRCVVLSQRLLQTAQVQPHRGIVRRRFQNFFQIVRGLLEVAFRGSGIRGGNLVPGGHLILGQLKSELRRC